MILMLLLTRKRHVACIGDKDLTASQKIVRYNLYKSRLAFEFAEHAS